MASESDRERPGPHREIRARLVPLRFDPAARDRLAAHAEGAYPLEACGLLFGEREEPGGPRVTHVSRLPNHAKDPAGACLFAPDAPPDAPGRAGSRARRQGPAAAPLGAWHSHPDRVPLPSDRDLAAAYPGLLHATISVRRGRAGARCAWRVEPVGDGRRRA